MRTTGHHWLNHVKSMGHKFQWMIIGYHCFFFMGGFELVINGFSEWMTC